MNIMQRVENMRRELIEIGISHGFQDPQVISLSQQLDELINQYYRLEGHEVTDVKIAS
ncbi:MAG: aspartyl-phosphate phosphatase Spo0E family protein [Syntrophomonas sp.]